MPRSSRTTGGIWGDAAGIGPFSHLDDLLALLDYLELSEVWLVGSSVGGKLALDAALVAPERVSGLVLLAPGVSGAPAPDEEGLEPQLLWLDQQIEQQVDLGNLDEVNRLETWLWLDGPADPRGGSAEQPAISLST